MTALRIGSILAIPVCGHSVWCVRGMVASVCMLALVVSGSCCGAQSLWLTMRMVLVCASSLVAILAHWMASKVVLCPWGMLGQLCFICGISRAPKSRIVCHGFG